MALETTGPSTVTAAPAVAPAPRTGRRRWAIRLAKALAVFLLMALLIRQRFFVTVPARSYVVERGDVVREVFGRGTVESRREVELGFDLVGRISDLLVDEGDRVKLGQV